MAGPGDAAFDVAVENFIVASCHARQGAINYSVVAMKFGKELRTYASLRKYLQSRPDKYFCAGQTVLATSIGGAAGVQVST
jgi:hypothetical protein